MEIEENIIKQFVIKNKQERFIYEISNAKKREEFFWRFAGTDFLKKECLLDFEYHSMELLEKKLVQLSNSTKAYYIGESFIGSISLKEALNKVECGEICILYCGNGIGYYQGEEDRGNTPRYILKNTESNK